MFIGHALGPKAAGLFTENERLQAASGAVTGERVWPMPMYDEYAEDIVSKFADVKNSTRPTPHRRQHQRQVLAAFYRRLSLGASRYRQRGLGQ